MLKETTMIEDFKFSKEFYNIIIAYDSNSFKESSMELSGYGGKMAIFNKEKKLIYLFENIFSWYVRYKDIFEFIHLENINISVHKKNKDEKYNIRFEAIFDLYGNELIPLCKRPEYFIDNELILVIEPNTPYNIYSIYTYDGKCIFNKQTLKERPILRKNHFVVSDIAYSAKDGKRIIPENFLYKGSIDSKIIFCDIDQNYFYGICESENEILLPCKYKEIKKHYVAKDKEVLICNLENDIEIYSKELNLMCKLENCYITKMLNNNGLLLKWPNSNIYRCGLIDLYGKEIISAIFSDITMLYSKKHNNLFKVFKGSYCGLYANEKMILPVDFEEIFLHGDDNYIIAIKGKHLIKAGEDVYCNEILESAYGLYEESVCVDKSPDFYEIFCEVYKFDGKEAKLYKSFYSTYHSDEKLLLKIIQSENLKNL